MIHGDQTIWFKMLEEGVKSFSSDTYQNAGKFMQGEFPLMLFALPAACLAMYHEAHTKNKNRGRYSVLCGTHLLPDGDHRAGGVHFHLRRADPLRL